MSTIDQQFVEYIVTSLVGNPDSVQVDRMIDEKGVLLTLTVHPDDLGRVIGKHSVQKTMRAIILRLLITIPHRASKLSHVETLWIPQLLILWKTNQALLKMHEKSLQN